MGSKTAQGRQTRCPWVHQICEQVRTRDPTPSENKVRMASVRSTAEHKPPMGIFKDFTPCPTNPTNLTSPTKTNSTSSIHPTRSTCLTCPTCLACSACFDALHPEDQHPFFFNCQHNNRAPLKLLGLAFLLPLGLTAEQALIHSERRDNLGGSNLQAQGVFLLMVFF